MPDTERRAVLREMTREAVEGDYFDAVDGFVDTRPNAVLFASRGAVVAQTVQVDPQYL